MSLAVPDYPQMLPLFPPLLQGCLTAITTLENCVAISFKLSFYLSYDSASRSWALTRKVKTFLHIKTCVRIFIEALFLKAQTRNKPTKDQQKEKFEC
jgi:hypothetical protein